MNVLAALTQRPRSCARPSADIPPAAMLNRAVVEQATFASLSNQPKAFLDEAEKFLDGR